MAKATETRVAVTVRLPYDQYREVCARARSREWSLAHYISHCIARELGSRTRPERAWAGNHNLELLAQQGSDDALGE